MEDAEGVGRKIIFDSGGNKETLFHNIKSMKIDLSGVEYIVLSHGHGDHTAATVELIEMIGDEVKVVVHPHLFQSRFYVNRMGKRRRGGVPKGESISDIERVGGKVIQTPEPLEILPGLWTTGQIPRLTDFEKISEPINGGRRLIVIEDEEIEDKILDDQALWMDLEGIGPMVVTGCAHSGAVNTLLRVRDIGGFSSFYGLIGGMHLVNRNDKYISRTIEELRKFDLELLSPCHCTGFKATALLYQAFAREFVLNFNGRTIEAGKEPKPIII
jgi:7,8-dihydropterin-6-yl-methyl-4-(beta-D-ribofuranosyl)aminobenzene 5'-phosphate synthase